MKELAKKNRKAKPKTKEEKELAALRRKRSDLKRLQTLNDKKLEAKTGPDTPVSDDLDFGTVVQQQQNQEVIFVPNKGPQTEFLAASERESCTAARQGEARVTLCLLTQCDISEIATSWAYPQKN